MGIVSTKPADRRCYKQNAVCVIDRFCLLKSSERQAAIEAAEHCSPLFNYPLLAPRVLHEN
jgi:glycerol-3-phosphate responsive antiterminator